MSGILEKIQDSTLLSIIVLVVSLALAGAILYFFYLLLVEEYGGSLSRKYRFKMFGFLGKLMFAVSLIYALIGMFASNITKNWGRFSMIGTDSLTSVVNLLTILSPLAALYFLNALIRTRSIIHGLCTTLIITAVAAIGGFIGSIIAGVLLVAFVAIAGFGAGASSGPSASERNADIDRRINNRRDGL